MSKELIVGKEAQTQAVSALTVIAEAVGTTLGPTGLPSIIDKPGVTGELQATVTKDGVTVLSNFNFDDPVKNAVWNFAKQSANQAVLESGDGTTSTIVLASYIANMIANTETKVPQAYARKIRKQIAECIEWVRENAVMDKNALKHVAMTSSNGDSEITDVVLDAVSRNGAYSTILVEKNVFSKQRYQLQLQQGYCGGRGYNWLPTLAMSADARAMENAPVILENCYVFCWNGEISHKEQIEPVINLLAEKTGSNFNLLCLGFDVHEGVGYDMIPVNREMNGAVKIMLCKTKVTSEPGAGLQTLLDVASICNSHVYDGGDYKNPKFEDIGMCPRVEISPHKTVFLGRNPNHWIPKRAQQNINALEGARTDLDRDIIQARNAELTDGLMTIIVGDGSVSDVQERADRVEDALKAIQSAQRAGVMPGCGVSYIKAGLAMNVEPNLIRALSCITYKILTNYGLPYNMDELEDLIRDSDLYDGIKIDDDEGWQTGNFLELGVADSAETIASVLKYGVELGILCSTTGCISVTTDLQKMKDLKALANLAQGRDI